MEHITSKDKSRPGLRKQQIDAKRHRRSSAVTQQTEELETFIDSLSAKINALRASSRILEGSAQNPPRFMDYARTRNLTSECLAFLIVIERRVETLPEEDRAPFRASLDQLTISLWSNLLECSLTFLRAISAEEYLPLGSREVFMREIKTLYDAHGTLSRPEFEGRIPDDILSRQKSAERILNEIIDRAPRLLDLGLVSPQ